MIFDARKFEYYAQKASGEKANRSSENKPALRVDEETIETMSWENCRQGITGRWKAVFIVRGRRVHEENISAGLTQKARLCLQKG